MIPVVAVRPKYQFTEFYMMTSYQPFEHLQCPIWIYDIDNKRITWANSSALPLWESESLFELTSRDFSIEMSKAIEATLRSTKGNFCATKASRHGGISLPTTFRSVHCAYFLGYHCTMVERACWYKSSLKKEV